jgi:hypothetical protein
LTASSSKYGGIVCFSIVTAVYFFSTWLTFKGFNGTDDLHYALLSSDLLKGKYNPFESNDIFSGRILLIAWQAFIYLILGITTFSTQVGTLLVTVVCCYLTIFKLARFKNSNSILLGCSLFYFNPVLAEASLGVLPDVYIMLAAIIVFLLWQKILVTHHRKTIILQSILIGLTVFAAMFFKENAFIFIPFLIFISLFTGKKKNIAAATISIATFFVCVLFSGWMYYSYTGDFFFRVHQVIHSNYPNVCSYATFSTKEKIARLTYGVWLQFIIESFYPVILAAILIVLRFLIDRSFTLKKDNTILAFIILFVLGLYFPFSLNGGYQPLCERPRHFIFLLPLGALICVNFFNETRKNQRVMWLFIAASSIILLACLLNSGQKWYWMIYGLLLFYFLIQKYPPFSFIYRARYLLFALILWLYMPYRLFFFSSNWFQNMRSVSTELKGNYFYFPDHDNMMHWKLLHGFDNKIHSISLEKNPFKIFKPYYENFDTTDFNPGWFIVNGAYMQNGNAFLEKINSLGNENFFTSKMCNGDICAYFIDTPAKLSFIKKVVADYSKEWVKNY